MKRSSFAPGKYVLPIPDHVLLCSHYSTFLPISDYFCCLFNLFALFRFSITHKPLHSVHLLPCSTIRPIQRSEPRRYSLSAYKPRIPDHLHALRDFNVVGARTYWNSRDFGIHDPLARGWVREVCTFVPFSYSTYI